MIALVRSNHPSARANLTKSKRNACLHMCLKNLYKDGPNKDQPKKGTFKAVGKKYNCHAKTVAAIWHQFDSSVSVALPGGDVKPRM